MSGSTPCRYSCRDLRDRDGNPFEQCRDSESVESEEIVVDVGAPGRGKRVRQTTRRPRTMGDDDDGWQPTLV